MFSSNLKYLSDNYIIWWNAVLFPFAETPNKKIIVSIFAFILLFLGLIFLRKIILKISRRHHSKIQLGLRPVHEIQYLKDIVDEIHYAACYCGNNPHLIPRCIKLLELCPEACNFALREHNYTPFLRACWNGCIELISYMISIGADIYAKTDAGEGGVYLATYCIVRNKGTDFTAIKLLLNAGLDINEERNDGYTALHLAATRGHTRLARWLLARGASPSPGGKPSPSHLAVLYGHFKTAALLKEAELKND